MQIPMLDLNAEYEYMKKDIDAALNTCIKHQRWIFGPEIRELEEKIAAYTGVKHCIGTSSGTDALVLSLRALSIRSKGAEYFSRQDLIITTPFTFTASGDAILRSGAAPVFVDIDPATYNINIEMIKECMRSQHGPKVVGIMPVHLYGQSCDMSEIMGIADENGLFVVEDAAQAFGGSWRGSKLGSIGTAGAFSFFPSKNLGGFGDAGMAAADDDELAELIRMLIRHGGKDKYNVDHIGYNARLDTIQAAVLLAKFKYIDEFNDRRKHLADVYNSGLHGLKDIKLPFKASSCDHVYHQFTISLDRRDELQAHLKGLGVSTMVYYPHPLHKMKVFGNGRSIVSGSLENAERACAGVLSLPMEPLQSENAASYVIESIRQFFS